VCGFAGEIRTDGDAPDLVALEQMSQVLAPRGPDGAGRWRHAQVGLVHRRLKIIDLSERGAQPMIDSERQLAVVFNGCIYNHHELRAELRAAGQQFTSESDTEVILASYDHWGRERFADHLVGMFAFAIVEMSPGGSVVLCRDRLGIKPLYLADVPGGLRFASTLPALLAGGGIDTALDPVALHHYLSFHSVVPAPLTILRGVRKLPPATLLAVGPAGERTQRTYWAPPFSRYARHAAMDADDWRDAVLERLRVAVRRRMVADVPVGVLLSGGLDSSLIVALLAEAGMASELQTFAIGFSDGGQREGNEFRYSDLVASQYGTQHHQIEVTDEEVVSTLGDAITAMSEPMVSHDVVAFHLLSREVSRHLKVIQSGQGADEVFAGYLWYPPLRAASGLGDDTYANEFIDRPHADILGELTPEYRLDRDPSRAFVRDHFALPGADTPLDRALRLDTEVMLVDDPVKRLDNMTMAWGLEARTPFLDHELVELAAACPPEHKLAHGGKGVLKQVARALLPNEVIDRPKGYFPVPLLSRLAGPALEFVTDALTTPQARARGVFNQIYIDRLLANPNSQLTKLEANRLWQVALLEIWLEAHGVS
jgi:asparagine synthase (glutamine-hydrolysing)